MLCARALGLVVRTLDRTCCVWYLNPSRRKVEGVLGLPGRERALPYALCRSATRMGRFGAGFGRVPGLLDIVLVEDRLGVQAVTRNQ